MSVRINSFDKIVKRLNIQEGGPAHAFFTATCAKKMDKYVPLDEGMLAGTVIEGGEPTSNVTVDSITYSQPYASYQYFGRRQDGSHVINEANRKRHMHSLATSYWDKKMKSAEMKDVVKMVGEYVRTHGGGK